MKKKKSKALIVEDEIRMRRVLIMLLSDFDLEFIEAEDGLQAKEAFDEGRFDLIITPGSELG